MGTISKEDRVIWVAQSFLVNRSCITINCIVIMLFTHLDELVTLFLKIAFPLVVDNENWKPRAQQFHNAFWKNRKQNFYQPIKRTWDMCTFNLSEKKWCNFRILSLYMFEPCMYIFIFLDLLSTKPFKRFYLVHELSRKKINKKLVTCKMNMKYLYLVIDTLNICIIAHNYYMCSWKGLIYNQYSWK